MRQAKENKRSDAFEPTDIDSAEDGGKRPTPEQIEESMLALSAPGIERSIPPMQQANFQNYTWDAIDETTQPLLAALDPESRRFYLKLGRVPALRRYDLGTFRVSEFHTVHFEVIPALGEAGYSEIYEFPAGAASPLDKTSEEDSPSPLARFLQLTDKNIPVPLALAEFDERSDSPEMVRALEGRVLVDELDGYGTQAKLGVTAPPTTTAAAVWTCFNGGDDVFEDAYCESKGIWFCESGSWIDLIHSSGDSKRYVSHTRVAGCNSGYATYVEHQFRYWNWWKVKWEWTAVKYPYTIYFFQSLMPGEVKYWKHVGSTKRRRKVHIWTEPNTYFRAWIAFYN